MNHQKVFKTRTKPKNSKPFYNAGCERFIRDLQNTEVHISVRDARVHEDDPLLGVIYLPLAKLFQNRSQIDANFPLSGGVGYGRARISMVFRSVKFEAPRKMLGWQYGTLDIGNMIKCVDLPDEIKKMRLKVRSNLARAKFHSGAEDGELNQNDGHVVWKAKKGAARLPVHKRYASPLIVEFRKESAVRDRTPAFCILWLKDIPDNEEQTLRLTVWKGDLERAENNVLSDCGEKIGEIEMTLTFWSGLSGYHRGLAKKHRHLKDVLEVLDICHDNEETDWDDGDSDDSSSSDSDDDSEKSYLPSFLSGKSGQEASEDGDRGMRDQIRDYQKHAKQLHRSNRGAMQWKAPRTLAYLKHLADRGENKVEDLFKHGDGGSQGIETEV